MVGQKSVKPLSKQDPEACLSNRILLKMIKSSGCPAERVAGSAECQGHLDKLGKLLSEMLEFTKVTNNAHVFLKKGIIEANEAHILSTPQSTRTSLKRLHPYNPPLFFEKRQRVPLRRKT